MEKLNVGIIGFGRIGAEHAGWINSCSDTQVACVFDLTQERRDLAESKNLPSTPSVDIILRDPSVNAVLISTPTSFHFEHAHAALNSGKHVMIEKPMTLDATHAFGLVEQAREAGCVLSVFHNRRWDVDYLTLIRDKRLGVFGRVFNVESRLGQWASCVGPAAREWRPGWRNEASFGGGGLLDWGSHFIDQLWILMQPAVPVRVYAQLRGNVWTTDCDDFARVAIDFDDGSTALCEINTTTTRPLPRWHVDGALGSASSPHSLEFDTSRWADFSFSPADGSGQQTLEIDGATSLIGSSAVTGQVERGLWSAFASACRAEGEPAVSPQSVLLTMKLLDAARQSSSTGRAILIDRVVGEVESARLRNTCADGPIL